MSTVSASKVTLTRADGRQLASGSTVAYTVTLDGQWIGWVYDERAWRGDQFGPRRWSATWRERDDHRARWTTYGWATRKAALDALTDAVREQTHRGQEDQ